MPHRLQAFCSDPGNPLASLLRTLPLPAGRAAAALVLCSADLARPVGEAEELLNAAAHAGATELLWIAPYFPPSSPLGQELRHAEALLYGSGKNVRVIRHGPLLSDLGYWRDEARMRRLLPFVAGTGALPWTAPEDVARAAERALAAPPVGRLLICGNAPCTGMALAKTLSRAILNNLSGARFAWRRFEEIDRDKNHALGAEEVVPYLTGLGYTPAEAQALLAAADVNRDGSIDFKEFTSGLGQRLDGLLRLLLLGDAWEVRCVELPRHAVIETLAQAGLRRAAAAALLDGWASLGKEGIPAGVTEATEAWLARPSCSIDIWADQQALDFVGLYILPGHGLLALGEGVVNEDSGCAALVGKRAAVTRLVDGDGRILSIWRATDGSGVAARWLDRPVEEVEEVRAVDASTPRALLVAEGRLAGLHVQGAWLGLSEAMGLLMARAELPGFQRAVFRQLGELRLEQSSALFDPREVLCNCTGLTRAQVTARIQGGCSGLAELSERTRAGQVCGGCKPVLEEMFGAPNLVQAEIKSLRELTQGVYQLRLTPVGKGVSPSTPGQHILVQGYVDKRWVTRAYTLSAPADASAGYEITVKREELGLFSRWLCDRAAEDAVLRTSSPRGEFLLPPVPAPRVVFFAGGIGVTPAMAMLRALATRPDVQRFLLDWSAPRESDFAYFEGELRALAARHPAIALLLRPTRTRGRLTPQEVRELYTWQPGSVALLCGPEPFMRDVREHLLAAGWPAERIRQEIFTSNVRSDGVIVPKPARRATVAGGICPVEHGSFDLQPVSAAGVREEAEAFLRQCYAELGLPDAFDERWKEVRASLESRGTYAHLPDELTYGARLAWRNSSRCIGRFFWSTLHVRDLRHLETEDEIFNALVEHIDLATNGGDLRAMISIFRPGEPKIRIWNGQLIRYAGYRQPDGTVLGDPANVELTEQALKLGWPGGGSREPGASTHAAAERTRFDLLPLILQIGNRPPRWFELPREKVLEVPIVHPRYAWFEELGLKWHALPAVASMAFDVGGIQYSAAPFNGFYMGTEIGARNFSDTTRYNQLPLIADRLGLDRSQSHTLWQDAALVELNAAVLHSFRKAKVRMLDHHAMSKYFMDFQEQERKCGRPVYADWIWIVPPISASTMDVFHQTMENRVLKPNYLYQRDPWAPPKR